MRILQDQSQMCHNAVQADFNLRVLQDLIRLAGKGDDSETVFLSSNSSVELSIYMIKYIIEQALVSIDTYGVDNTIKNCKLEI